MSAETCAAGFFPPHGYEIWDRNLNWQPVPIHSLPIDRDNVLGFTKKCDRYDALSSIADSIVYYRVMEKYEQLIIYIEKNSGQKLSTLHDLKVLYQTLYVERYRGLR